MEDQGRELGPPTFAFLHSPALGLSLLLTETLLCHLALFFTRHIFYHSSEVSR